MKLAATAFLRWQYIGKVYRKQYIHYYIEINTIIWTIMTFSDYVLVCVHTAVQNYKWIKLQQVTIYQTCSQLKEIKKEHIYAERKERKLFKEEEYYILYMRWPLRIFSLRCCTHKKGKTTGKSMCLRSIDMVDERSSKPPPISGIMKEKLCAQNKTTAAPN